MFGKRLISECIAYKEPVLKHILTSSGYSYTKFGIKSFQMDNNLEPTGLIDITTAYTIENLGLKEEPEPQTESFSDPNKLIYRHSCNNIMTLDANKFENGSVVYDTDTNKYYVKRDDHFSLIKEDLAELEVLVNKEKE